MRPAPPPTPYTFPNAHAPDDKSLVLTSYAGNYIPAWNLQPCLTEGFKQAADVLSEDTPAHYTALVRNTWTCDENGIEIVIFGNRIPGSADLDFFDLATILTLISEFHQRYAMRNTEFQILGSSSVPVGHGWVELVGNGVRIGNASAFS